MQVFADVKWYRVNKFDQSGFVTILDRDNKVLSNQGGQEPAYKNDILQPTLQAATPVFMHGHDVCLDEDKVFKFASGMVTIKHRRS